MNAQQRRKNNRAVIRELTTLIPVLSGFEPYLKSYRVANRYRLRFTLSDISLSTATLLIEALYGHEYPKEIFNLYDYTDPAINVRVTYTDTEHVIVHKSQSLAAAVHSICKQDRCSEHEVYVSILLPSIRYTYYKRVITHTKGGIL